MEVGECLNHTIKKRKEINNSFYYWEDVIKKNTIYDLFIGNMGNKKITKGSIIMYVGFHDKKKNILKSGWSYHSDIDSFLGYMTYVFIPTAFYNWIDRDSDGFYVPLSQYEVVKREVMAYRQDEESIDDSRILDYFLAKTQSIWGLYREESIERLKLICEGFNEVFDDEPFRKINIQIFGHAEEILDFIVGEDEFLDVVEEEIGMPIDELKEMCEKVYDEPLINKTFIDHLNQEIPIWF